MRIKIKTLGVFLILIILSVFSCTNINDPGNTTDTPQSSAKGSAVIKIIGDSEYPVSVSGNGYISSIHFKANFGELTVEQTISSFSDYVLLENVNIGEWNYEVNALDDFSSVYQSQTGTITIDAVSELKILKIVLKQKKVTPVAVTPTSEKISIDNTISFETKTNNAVYYYSIDGSDPLTGIEYTEPFSLEAGTYTLKVISKADGMDDSVVFEKEFIVSESIATPIISPLSGSYSVEQAFTIECGTQDSVIYYTLDGSVPSKISNQYSTPFQIDTIGTYIVKAVASYNGQLSEVASETIVIEGNVEKAKTPVILPGSTNYTVLNFPGLTFTSEDALATIFYTTNGDTPDINSTLYEGSAVSLSEGTYTVKAIAFVEGFEESDVVSTYYSITNSSLTILPELENYTESDFPGLSFSFEDQLAEIYYTTNGTTPNKNSTKYTSGTISLAKGDYVIKAIAYLNGIEASPIVTSNYSITTSSLIILPELTTQKESNFPGLTFSCDDAEAEIFYTTNGSTPDMNATKYTGVPVALSKGNYTVKAIAYCDGVEITPVVSSNFIITIATLTILPELRTQKESDFPGLTFTCDETGTEIYYTTNGSLPDNTSTQYNGVPVSLLKGDYTVKVIAYDGAVPVSSVTSANYTITGETMPVLTSVIVKYGKPAMTVGEVYRFTGEAKYDTGISSEDVNWELSDTTIASITYDGTLTALKEGTVLVYAEKSGMKSTAYSLTVSPAAPEGIKIFVDETFGNQLYAWLDGNIALLGAWPGKSLATPVTLTAGGVEIVIGKEAHYYTVLFVNQTKINYLVLKDGTKKTADDQLATETTTWYADGSKKAGTPDDVGPQLPKVSATPAGGVKPAGTYSVTLNVSGESVTNSKYTINGSDPAVSGIAFTDGTSISITLSTGSTVVLKMSAENGEGVATELYTFTEGIAPKSVFSWDNINCYFVLTDRFVNGTTANDHSYGRESAQNGTPISGSNYENRPGTFNGGDLKGLTSKVTDNYFTDLGINAIWLTSPLEQIHGWVAGGGPDGSFKHYGYHGYYVLDPTEIDANMGTEQEFKDFVAASHEKGIRVVVDIVINHLGYENMKDMSEFNYGGLKSGWDTYYFNATDATASWDTGLAPKMDFTTSNWAQWYGPSWVRKNDVGGGYDPMGSGVLGQYNFNLPDIKTESSQIVDIPPVLVTKWGGTGSAKYIKEKAELDAFFSRTGKARTSRNYMIKWMTDMIRKYGVDGFRLDTVNNLDIASVRDLAETCKSEFNYVKQTNPGILLDPTAEFWMTGEAYDHGVNKSNLFTEGKLDSIINFQFPKDGNLGSIGSTWAYYANAINNDSTFNVLSYISSHDKGLGRGDMRNLGTALVLSPGGVQVFYGDETARPASVGGEPGWRSKMNWNQNPDTLVHWQKVGSFRRDHVAVGAGSQTDLGNSTYGRSYSKNGVEDKVVIKLNGGGSISVAGMFADGTLVRDAYTGATATVSGGSVSFTDGGASVIIIEKAE
ncbi:MAG: hypothetical protein A2015_01395 [Spirochaetes bacterium GWF1_31_7]|nr:MAG: hypothetical protein A2Y30_07985 [Spirochaetes bacterium GWE1_32_154]OHD47848.1 MAG: hypothetical protein A2015_01395 [Spirochaetes bacterium GWF1_31_7]OHD52209.1 MAG: hypothetical protein A2Y29_17630 [Spirochaetes bacterium GWE2_31_10]